MKRMLRDTNVKMVIQMGSPKSLMTRWFLLLTRLMYLACLTKRERRKRLPIRM